MRSVAVDLDGDRHLAGKDLVDGAAGSGMLDDLPRFWAAVPSSVSPRSVRCGATASSSASG
jgi:hypothetical protein